MSSPPPSGGAFVGRVHELGELRAGLGELLAGQGRLFLISGEPGIGKTRLVEELAADASRRGAQVVWGRSWEDDSSPPFWPWRQVLRALLNEGAQRALAAELPSVGRDLAQIVPDLRSLLPPDRDGEAEADSKDARFRLFDAVSRFLHDAAARCPLLLAFDDLHWADQPSLRLLHFVARHLAGAPILLVGAFRDVEASLSPQVADELAALARYARRVSLRGLSAREVEMLIAGAAAEAASSLAPEVYETTQGNPFFVDEIVRLLAAEGKLAVRGRSGVKALLPAGVRDTIRRRLELVSPECRRLVAIASVFGRDFAVAPLAGVAEVALDEALARLDEARHAGLIVRAEDRVGRVGFAHDLLRETLYADLGDAPRVAFHERIGRALEQLYGGEADAHLAELAHHFCTAAVAGDPRAIDYSLRAGARAAQQLAFEEAVEHYERALGVLDLAGAGSAELHCDVMLRLADAHWSAGDFGRSKQAYRRAAEIAPNASRLAAAALGAGGLDVTFDAGDVDHDLVSLLERSRLMLESGDPALRARVTARLAAALTFSPDRERRAELAREAVAGARALGDPATLAYVLNTAHWATWGPDELDERRVATAEMIALAGSLSHSALAVTAHLTNLAHLLEAGDGAGAAREFDLLEQQAQSLRQPSIRFVAAMSRPMRALLEGRLDEVEELARQALVIGQEGRNRAALQIFGTQLAMLRREQGRIAEVVGAVADFAERLPAMPAWRAGLAWLTCELGDEAAARHELERLAAADFADVPRDLYWTFTLVFAADVVARLRDGRRAQRLYELLKPYSGRCAVMGGVAAAGSLDRSLGRLAAISSRFDEAATHFERALEMNGRLRAFPWKAHTEHDYARMLIERDQPRDRERAADLLEQALATAERLGMTLLAERAADDLRVAGQIGRSGADVARGLGDTVTILFTDIEGFTTLAERLGDRRAHEVIVRHDALVRRRMRENGGREVETLGDGFLLAFPSAAAGLRCAVAIQRDLVDYGAAHPDHPLRVRMGFHTGEPLREGKKFFGKAVILASRIAAQAKGGEILASSVVRDLAADLGDFRFDAGRDLALKGLTGTHRVFAVLWNGDAAAEVEAPTPADARDEVPADSRAVFRREGDYWMVGYAGRQIRLRDSKGLHYVAALLGKPRVEIHVATLAGAGDGGEASESPVAEAALSGNAGELLDSQATAEYRRRLEDLKEELEEATRWRDEGRTSRLRAEMSFITRELSAAYGLGGRTRKAADGAERMRKAVTSRIRASIARIAEQHAPLARHLESSMRLGTFCSYEPELPVAWDI